MSKIRVVPLDFMQQAGMLVAKDHNLFEAVHEFTRRELQEPPNYGHFNKNWVAVRVNAAGVREEVVGLCGIRTVPDIALFRATETEATVKLSNRINDHLADQGFLGHDCFLYVSPTELEEQRCANWAGALSSWAAKPADRHIIVVR